MIRLAIVACAALITVTSTVAADAQSSSLTSATALVVYKLAGPTIGARPASLDDNPKFEGYHILDVEVVSKPETVKQIVAVVASQLKASGNPAACFQPGMAVRILGSGSVTDVLVCLDCNNMSVPGSTRLVAIAPEARRILAGFYADVFHSAR